ncbi:MAG: SUMF1/EgtB/PvdO family nonheme iron enzyme, partial [Pseudomonadota bacterium]
MLKAFQSFALTLGLSLSLATAALAEGASGGIDQVFEREDDRSFLNRLVARAGFGDFQRSYALVIGVNEFADFSYLPTAEDPKRLATYLFEEAGFDYVHLLTGEAVTRQRLEGLFLDEFREKVNPNDRFLFYWSGHGETVNVRGVEKGFLPLANSDKTKISTMIAMSDVKRWDGFIDARHVLYLLDSCFSGLVGNTPQSADLAKITREQLSGPGRHIIAAGLGDEQTIAVGELGGSIFTHALLKGLRGRADVRQSFGDQGEVRDGIVTFGELKTYISTEVGRLSKDYGWTKSITPQITYLRDSEGGFFFPVAQRFPEKPKDQPPQSDQSDSDITSMGAGEPSAEDMKFVQQTLADLGYKPGSVDGILSFATRRALTLFQRDKGLARTGKADPETQEALLDALFALEQNESDVETADQPLKSNKVGVLGDLVGGDEAASQTPDCDVCPEMVDFEGGNFRMGTNDSKPEYGPKRVKRVAPFAISTTEVTRASFKEFWEHHENSGAFFFIESDPSCFEWQKLGTEVRLVSSVFSYPSRHLGAASTPVTCVNRGEVSSYLAWLNEQAGIQDPALQYRLPTEAEFEFLLSASVDSSGYLQSVLYDREFCGSWNGAGEETVFNHKAKGCRDAFKAAAPVGSFPFDLPGVYDLRGNVWEWVAECWATESRDASA